MDLKNVGERIRQQRKIKDLTQEELAKKVNLSTMSIRRYEGGDRIIPENTLQRIASALGVTVADLVVPDELVKYDEDYKGFVSLMIELYGSYEEKDIQAENGGSGCYYLVGKGKDRFILSGDDVDKIMAAAKEASKTAIKPLVELLKNSEPEEEYVKAYLKEMGQLPPEGKK